MSDPAVRRLGFARVWTSRVWIASALLLWGACSAVYFLTAPGRIDMFDGGIRHEVTESLIDIGVPAVRDPAFPGLPGRWGYRYAWYELGSSIAAVPFVWVGAKLGHGSLESRQFAFSMTTVPFASAVVAFVFLIYGRLGCRLRAAVGWSLILAFGTLLWPYAGSSFDAAMQAFFLTVAVWAAVEALASGSFGWAIASAASFAMLINVQEAYLVLIGCAAAVFPVSMRRVQQRLRNPIFAVILTGAVAGLILIGAANFLRYGDPTTTGRQITSGANPVWGNPIVALAGMLVSPAKSIFLYSPTCALAVIGLSRLMKRDPDRFAPVVACLALHLGLISMLRFWHGEWAWGPRYLVATVPLVSIGLPFAWPSGRRITVKAAVCGAGVLVQCLAVSVDHQRYYFDRSLEPFFWLDESWMYRDSPLFARPRELVSVIQQRDVQYATALVPGPRSSSMTSSIFGPSPEELATGHLWVRQYLVFDLPRPWSFWSQHLFTYQRPGNTRLMTLVGEAATLVCFGGLFALVFAAGRGAVSAVSQAEEAEEKTGQHDLPTETYR